MKKPQTTYIEGLWGEYPQMKNKINTLLKSYGLRLKVQTRQEWADEVRVSVEELNRNERERDDKTDLA